MWQYLPSEHKHTNQKNTKKIAVLIFEERLNDKGISENNAEFMSIPLIPYVTIHNSSPGNNIESVYHNKPEGQCVRQAERGEGMFFNPSISLSYALTKELEEAKLFSKIEYVCTEEDIKRNPDYIIKGIIKDKSVDKIIYSYGLTIMSIIPWSLGLPVSSAKVNLSMQLELINARTGETLFKETYSRVSAKKYKGFYYSESEFDYPELSRDIFNNFVKDIEKFK